MQPNKWTDEELETALRGYFKMLNYQKQKTRYVKAEVNREIQKSLVGRSNKSIEYRWQNISSVLNDANHEWVLGYKPASHVGDFVKERLTQIIRKLKLADI
jgi:5-methylcytosine-specific restriction protein A